MEADRPEATSPTDSRASQDSPSLDSSSPDDATPESARRALDLLSTHDRLRLMKFICSFAWADLEIHPEERSFTERMLERLDLGADADTQVQRWLAVPPSPESVDPTRIPAEHRQIFVQAIKGVIAADGEIAPEESENLALLEDLLSR